MRLYIFNLQTAVWLVLMLATGISWWLGTGSDLYLFGDNAQMSTITMMIISFFKLRLVIMHFMEVQHAPTALRAIMDTWVFGVCVIVLALYLRGPGPVWP